MDIRELIYKASIHFTIRRCIDYVQFYSPIYYMHLIHAFVTQTSRHFDKQSLSTAHERNFCNVFGYTSIFRILLSGIARHVGTQNDVEGFGYAADFWSLLGRRASQRSIKPYP